MTARRQKIRDPIKYPEFIDLTPYTTAFRDSQHQQQQKQRKYATRQQQTLSQKNNVDYELNQNTKNGSLRHLARLANKLVF